MSGHSKWSTIKRQKESTDAARGKIFSKLAKGISVAAKTGGADPDTNHKLRAAIETAKSANMPKVNIERALSKAQAGGGDLEEVVYEGFGPSGVSVMVEVATDNRNRAGQEIKNLFERVGGRLAGPGAVSFNFEHKGLITLEKSKDEDTQMLDLIDAGAEDIEETNNGLEAYTTASALAEVRKAVEEKGYKVVSSELVQKPKMFQKLEDKTSAAKVLKFLQSLEDNEDVQKVFANVDIPEEVIKDYENE